MSANANGASHNEDFFLTPHQQSLLFAALNTNKQQAPAAPIASNPVSLSPSSFKNSPSNGAGAGTGYQESPFLDNYEYEFGDSSFDFSFANNDQGAMIGDMPSTSDKSDSPEDDLHDKRSHPDDDDDDETDPKRRESSDKIPKKPGRKPLTSEPTSKRKAQNRAAQRAFRERKERHLKDLETKVEELEKASEAANHENSKLRAQVERMNTELKQYKQKMSVMAAQTKAGPANKQFGNAAVSKIGDVNFQFEFPKFGALPGVPNAKPKRSVSQPLSPQSNTQGSSPALSLGNDVNSPQQSAAQFKEDLAKFSNIFSPSMASSIGNGSRASLDSANFSGFGAATSSPSASSNSNAGGPSSSCGTSPEPFIQSPLGFKPVDTMSTIGEEQLGTSTAEQQAFANFSNVDFGSTGLDWLAQQNGGQFDPQLFGGYREPQQNLMANPAYDDFFNDAFDVDFFTPFNTAPATNLKKSNLIAEIDAKQDSIEEEVPEGGKNRKAHEIWEKLQACPDAQNGDFDLDGLCSELTKKAKCSGNGPVVGEVDFDTILKKYMGKAGAAECVANKLGLTVEPKNKAGAGSARN